VAGAERFVDRSIDPSFYGCGILARRVCQKATMKKHGADMECSKMGLRVTLSSWTSLIVVSVLSQIVNVSHGRIRQNGFGVDASVDGPSTHEKPSFFQNGPFLTWPGLPIQPSSVNMVAFEESVGSFLHYRLVPALQEWMTTAARIRQKRSSTGSISDILEAFLPEGYCQQAMSQLGSLSDPNNRTLDSLSPKCLGWFCVTYHALPDTCGRLHRTWWTLQKRVWLFVMKKRIVPWYPTTYFCS
jgi:hypothetical protein